MKRGQPLQRRTPLRVRTPLQTRTELRSHSTLRRGGQLAPVSAKRSKANAQRQRVVSAMRAAAGDWCPRCGRSGVPLRGHERLARAHGGDIIHPDVLICDPCNGAIEDDPKVSCWNGWKLSPKWSHDPALSPSQARALDGSIVEFEVPAEVA